jgi:hypothetical protein
MDLPPLQRINVCMYKHMRGVTPSSTSRAPSFLIKASVVLPERSPQERSANSEPTCRRYGRIKNDSANAQRDSGRACPNDDIPPGVL